MNKVSLFARLLKYGTILWFVPLAMSHLFFWGRCGLVEGLRGFASWLEALGASSDCCVDNGIFLLTPLEKAMVILLDFVPVVLAAVVIVWVVNTLNCFQHGEFFSLRVVTLLRRVGFLSLVWVIYQIVFVMMMSFFSTMHNPVGKRQVMITIGSDDVFRLFFVVLIYFISYVLYEAYKLKQEQELTV